MGKLICRKCQREFSPDRPIWRCPCGGLLHLDFQPLFPIDQIEKRSPTLWRYREAIPIREDAERVSFAEGFTPLVPMDLEGRRVWLKQDHLFPTGSYKDRGATVLISKAKELGIRRVVEDSSGNAGCAIAAYCAQAQIHCEIYVPADTSPAKLAQIQCYGAVLHRVPGSREDTARAVWNAAEREYYASHCWNPFFFQGTKTFAYEVCEQLGWKAPEVVVLPVGHGTLLLGAFIGFAELQKAGIIRQMPRIIAVQSARCAPLAEAFEKNMPRVPRIQKGETLAEGIAIAEPIRGEEILEAVRKSRGQFISVQEEEIVEALERMGRKGFYIEPTAAATIAGLQKYLVSAEPGSPIVSVLTGHGLKATEKMLRLWSEKGLRDQGS